jgi:hypothetical protein
VVPLVPDAPLELSAQPVVPLVPVLPDPLVLLALDDVPVLDDPLLALDVLVLAALLDDELAVELDEELVEELDAELVEELDEEALEVELDDELTVVDVELVPDVPAVADAELLAVVPPCASSFGQPSSENDTIASDAERTLRFIRPPRVMRRRKARRRRAS